MMTLVNIIAAWLADNKSFKSKNIATSVYEYDSDCRISMNGFWVGIIYDNFVLYWEDAPAQGVYSGKWVKLYSYNTNFFEQLEEFIIHDATRCDGWSCRTILDDTCPDWIRHKI